jgi:hypothetical protein
MTLDQQPQLGELRQFARRAGRHLETALAFGDDEPLRNQAAQDLAQCADAYAINGAQLVQRQPLPRLQPPEHDILPDALIGLLAGRKRGDFFAAPICCCVRHPASPRLEPQA